MRSLLPVALVLAAVTACSDSDDDNPVLQGPTPTPTAEATTSAPASGGPAEVRAVQRNRFVPDALTIKAGQSVKVLVTDPDVSHNFVVDGVGRSPTMQVGDTYSLRFDKPGTYKFVCTFHEARGMVGTVTVTS